MSDDIVDELRGWENNLHVPDERGFCKTCSIRMPCDWAMAVADMSQAADEIERLRAALPTWYRVVDNSFDNVKLGFTWIVSVRDLVEVPRGVLVDHVVRKFRQGLIAEMEELRNE